MSNEVQNTFWVFVGPTGLVLFLFEENTHSPEFACEMQILLSAAAVTTPAVIKASMNNRLRSWH